MSKSRVALIGLSFAAGVGLVVLSLPLVTGEPRIVTATNAMLTIQNALPSLFSTSPLAASTKTLRDNRVHPPATSTSSAALYQRRGLEETLSFDGPPPKRRERLW
jgi:hypothetical protein